MEYSYQFSAALQQEWVWTERYAGQPEILRYIEHVADRFRLRDGIAFGRRVTAARFDDAAGRWTVDTDRGEKISARWCIMATGCLSAANVPSVPGLEDFHGPWYHTGRWPHEGVDLAGRRVGVIGTGSSGIQAIPMIAAEARHLTVFQRTPAYSVPAHNGPLAPEVQADVKARYDELRRQARRGRSGLLFTVNDASALAASAEERERIFEERWRMGGIAFLGSFNDLLVNKAANDTAADFVRRKIRSSVRDPAVAAALSPGTVIGCKRLCLDTGYYATYNRPNVRLVDGAAAPIERITPSGVMAGGALHPIDALVFATGYDAMTGALTRIDIRGTGGRSLGEKWAAGPRTLLGLATAGFPNLFIVTGPGSPSVLSNVLPSIEQHVEWIAACIAFMRARGLAAIEPVRQAEDDWVAHVNEVAGRTLYVSCSSWYLGANIPGKPRVFMPYVGFPAYVEKCEAVAANGYPGFAFGTRR
jgi:cyclohexanone monooxygenase